MLLKSSTVALKIGIPSGTLRYWRKVGVGPPFVKLEGSIYYPEDDLMRYIKDRTHQAPVHKEINDARV